jgi:ABC-type transport system involved in multi-copper enzyme maturation permease subunit
MKKTLAIATAVVADAIRRKVVWVVVVFTALLAIAIPGLPSYGGLGIVGEVYKQVSIALMWVAALIVALALSATRVPVEVERRTVFNIVSRDVRRWQYVVGTWLGMFFVLGLVILAFCIGTIAVGWFSYSQPMFILLEAGFAVWLEIGVIMAFTVMLSTLFGPVTSVVGGLALAFIGHAVVSFLHVPETQRVPPWIPSLDVFNVINPVALGNGVSAVYLFAMVIAFVGWVSLFMLGGSLMFAGRDL